MADFIIGKPAGGTAKSEKDYLFSAAYASSPALKDYFAKTASNPYEREKTIAMFDSQIEFCTQTGNRGKRDFYRAAKDAFTQLTAEYAKQEKAVTSPINVANPFSLRNDNIFA